MTNISKSMLPALDYIRTFLCMTIVVLLGACGSDNTESNTVPGHDDFHWSSGSRYNGIGNFFSDDRILNTPHFAVYSNGTSDAVRIAMGELLEEAFAELMQTFMVDGASSLNNIRVQVAVDVNNGFLGLSAPISLYLAATIFDNVDNVSVRSQSKGLVKHELAHLFELQLGGINNRTHRWFWEGVAIYTAANHRLTTLQQVQDWKALAQDGNPIGIRLHCSLPQQCQDYGLDYYPIFGLTMAYLLDPQGNGSGYQNIVDLYAELSSGSGFEPSFTRQFGISPDEFQTNYYTLIEQYLER